MNKTNLKRLLIGVLIAVSASVPLTASAVVPNGWDRVYYDDAAHTVEAGEETLYCTGDRHIWWGARTAYFDQVLFAFLLLKNWCEHSSSIFIFLLSIQPKQSASSTASLQEIVGMFELFL